MMSQFSDRHRKIICMWVRGFDMDAIAATLGTSRGSITRTAHNLGLPRRSCGARDRNLWPCVVHWARLGWSAEQIADGLGVRGKAKELLVEDLP